MKNPFARFFKTAPVSASAPKPAAGSPMAVISRTDPMTGRKVPLSFTARPERLEPLPSESFDRLGFGYRQKERDLS